jgi:hypothetical protein
MVTVETIYKLTIYHISFDNTTFLSWIIIALLAKQNTLLLLL